MTQITMSAEERKMQDLFESAHRDQELKRKLLADPVAVSKEWGVAFGDREVEQLKKLSAFIEMAEEVKFGRLYPGCDPRVCYPVSVWLKQELIEIVPKIPIGYPPDYLFNRRRFGDIRR